MKHFKFKFSYKSKSCKATGDGTISADSIEQASKDAQIGVANDFDGSITSVVITSITESKKH